MKTIDKQKNMIEDRKKELREKERTIRAKEKKFQEKKFIDLGRLVFNAKISSLQEDALFGALLEIAEKSKDKVAIDRWLENSRKFSSHSDQNTPLVISFKSPPKQEVKMKLKEQKFRWNSFRGEYYGYGIKEKIAALFCGEECNIEVVR